jgi:exodeoxyribonuclease VII large subunit
VKAQLWLAGSDLSERQLRLRRGFGQHVERAQSRLAAAEARLKALNPLGVLGRGYAVVRDAETQAVLRSVGQARPGQALDVLLADGRLKTTVETIS